MHKKILFPVCALFMICIIGAVSITEFIGYSSPENITFSGNENYTRQIFIHKDAVVSDARLNLSGFKNDAIGERMLNISSFDIAGDGCDNAVGSGGNSTHLLITDTTDDEVYVYDYNGNLITHFDTYASGNSAPYGIATNGTHIFVYDPTDALIYVYTSGGSFGYSYSFNPGRDYITYLNNYIYAFNTSNYLNRYYAKNGTYSGTLKNFNGILPGADIGLATDGDYFYIVPEDDSPNKVYVYNLDMSPVFNATLNFTDTGIDYLDGVSISGKFLYVVDGGGTDSVYKFQIDNFTYPTNTSILLNNTQIWNHSGEFNSTFSPNQTSNFSSSLMDALNSGGCDCTGCSLEGVNCTVNFTFHSDNAGILESSALGIEWTESTEPTLDILAPANGPSSFDSTAINVTINATDDWELSECWYNITRGASVEVENTQIANCENTTAYVSSRDTTYILTVFINDTSGNSNLSTSTFTVPATAVIVTGGGGGSVEEEDDEEAEEELCMGYKEAFETAWEESKTEEDIVTRIESLWDKWWDYILCSSASSIVPI